MNLNEALKEKNIPEKIINMIAENVLPENYGYSVRVLALEERPWITEREDCQGRVNCGLILHEYEPGHETYGFIHHAIWTQAKGRAITPVVSTMQITAMKKALELLA